VRRAVIQLTAEGLVEPVRRRGTVVRVHPARRPVSRSRLVYRDELGYYFDQAAQGWRPLQPPSVSRGPVPFDVAARLGVAPGDEAVIRERIMGDLHPLIRARLPASAIAVRLATTADHVLLAATRNPAPRLPAGR
jgi:DNA-binding GntR family transcriptional regulator